MMICNSSLKCTFYGHYRRNFCETAADFMEIYCHNLKGCESCVRFTHGPAAVSGYPFSIAPNGLDLVSRLYC